MANELRVESGQSAWLSFVFPSKNRPLRFQPVLFMKFQSTVVASALFASFVAPGLWAAEGKRVVVVTVTTGFRHSSIGTAEKVLQKLADESKAFQIVDYVRQPAVEVPKKPAKPRPLKPDADDKAKAAFAKQMENYEKQMAAWTPEMENELKAAQTKLDEGIKSALARLSPDRLKADKVDGVIFANTTGNLPLPDPEGFIRWISEGHAFMAMHSASDTLHGFPGYIDMLQGEFLTHGAQVPADLVAGDQEHPANGGLGAAFELKQEEMYQIKSQDRSKVRSLWFLKHHPNVAEQAGFFPVSWCRKAGGGNVFYTSLGHREDVWDDSAELPNRINPPEVSRKYQAHILGGIKWALGLLPGSAEPNPSVGPQ